MQKLKKLLESNKLRLILSVFFCIKVSAAIAAVIPVDSEKGQTQFRAIGRPSAIKISGQGLGPKGSLELAKDGDQYQISGVLEVDLESLKTGIELRDTHMKEKYLETGKDKTARLILVNANLKAALVESGGSQELTAQLKLHGVEKPTQVSVQFNPSGGKLQVHAQFVVSMTDHQIPVPNWAGITVANRVEVEVTTEVDQSKLMTEAKN